MGGFDWSSTNKAACPDFHAANVRAKCRSNDRLSLASIRRDACFQHLSGQTSMASTMRIWRTSIHLSITMPRLFFDWHARRRRPTHRLFLFQGFAFFFWTGEDGEPVHVHVAKGILQHMPRRYGLLATVDACLQVMEASLQSASLPM